jgi:HD superfamily phosphohydrolase
LKAQHTNKRKILNDPVHGFINIPSNFIFDLIEHPYFQRLRRITQLGLTYLVYPGAYHTRFHHAIGAMHLMNKATEVLVSKGHEITQDEKEAVMAAILLHDIGHGPFSHALEHSIVKDVTHEHLSKLFMRRLNEEFDGKLSLAIQIFENKYPKHFLHELIASQLDMDRLDYLRRDSFFTGVSEGMVNTDRLIAMMNVVDDHLVIDAKGIYSVEKFIVSRRLMYWQVYLHKTVLSAEFILMEILKRAKLLAQRGMELFATENFSKFLYNEIGPDHFENEEAWLEAFSRLDDFDIYTSVKSWTESEDAVLSYLCRALIERRLFKIIIGNSPFSEETLEHYRKEAERVAHFAPEDLMHIVISGEIANSAYDPERDNIRMLYKDGRLMDIAEAADQLNIHALSHPVRKYFICFPKECKPYEG